jgi:uncharacterized membrane protein YciS (DUF1049 family)
VPVQHVKRRLRNYLLNSRYQLRFALTIVFIAAVLTAGLGALVYEKTRETSRVIETQQMAAACARENGIQFSFTDADRADLRAQFSKQDRQILWVLLGFGSSLIAVLFIYGIIVTHKVAGPLYKISLYLKGIRDGRLGPIYSLRKGDQLHDFYEVFRQAHDALRQRTQEEVRVLAQAIQVTETVLQGAGEREELNRKLDELRELKRRKEESLV